MVGQLARGMYEFLILNLITLAKAVKLEVEGPDRIVQLFQIFGEVSGETRLYQYLLAQLFVKQRKSPGQETID